MLGAWGDAAGAKFAELRDALTCRLDQLVTAAGLTSTGTTGTARTLAYQYGTPPEVGAPRLAPRSMTALPWVIEGTTAERVRLDVLDQQGRYGFAGYVANIGEGEMLAAWVGVDGSTSGLFTVPPAATVQVPCIIRGVLLEPVDGEPARYQVSIS